MAGDLLRDFYAAVVPNALRRQLGEFFTPQWLAERTLSRALELAELDDSRARILDPACGSGTFLVAALNRALRVNAAQEGVDEVTAVWRALEDTIGFDINPVAVLMSRVNLILALGQLVENLTEVRIHVYQTDSILLPEPVRGQASLEQQGPLRRIPLEIGDVDIHSALANLPGLAALRHNIERAVEERRPAEDFRRRLVPDLRRLGLEAEQLAEAAQVSTVLYERLLELSLEGRNGVWARIIEQSFAPSLIGTVDLVVGNPPWINWKHLPEAWQGRSEPTWRRWGLWATRVRGGGVPLADISVLLLARSIATYLRTGGVLGFLLPESVLIADPGNERIRQCCLGPLAEDLVGTRAEEPSVDFQPLEVDDWTGIAPFSPDAANRPIGLYVRAGSLPHFPINKNVWRRSRARTHMASHQSWVVTQRMLSSVAEEISPVEDGNTASPWVPSGSLALLPKGDEQVHYRWGQGFHTRGADGRFICEVLTPRPDPNGRVRIRSCPHLGRNTASEEPREGVVEAEFLWPLTKGENVLPFSIASDGLYVVVPHNPQNLVQVLTVQEMIDKAPGLYDFLEPWIPLLTARSPYQELQPTAERPWGIQGPWNHLTRRANLVMVRYMHPAKRPPAGVRTPALDPKLGLLTTAYPNNKSNFIAAATEQEAHYLAACVNSTLCQDAIARVSSTTTIGPTSLQRLPIPAFDVANRVHLEVATIGQEIHHCGYQGDVLRGLDDAVGRLLAPSDGDGQ